jgi:hypothetical protein
MKFLKLTLITASILAVTSAQAITYKFVAADNSPETKLCVLAGSDEMRKLKRTIKNQPLFNRYIPNLRYVSNNIKCNDMFMVNFASRYNADKVANYLDRYTYPKNKHIETNVTIKDLALLPTNNDSPDKVITVYVGG